MRIRKYKYNKGKWAELSLPMIAALMNCHVATARRWLKGRDPATLTPDDIGHLIWLYREQKDISGILKEIKKRKSI